MPTFAVHSLNNSNAHIMTEAEIIQIQNEIFTKLVIDLLKEQRAKGIKDFCLDKYEVDRLTKEKLKKKKIYK